MDKPWREWFPMSQCFPGEQQADIGRIFPDAFEVMAGMITNKPSAEDPLGSKPGLSLGWQFGSNPFLVSATVHGATSPWLEPRALMTWLIVEYPDTFRWRP